MCFGEISLKSLMIDVVVENNHAKNRGRLYGQIFRYRNCFKKVLYYEIILKFDML